MRACTAPGCNAKHLARNYCYVHYWRWYRYGTPTPAVLPSRDVDEIAVERAIAGDPPDHLTFAERELVVRALHARKMPDPWIAEHLDIGPYGVRSIRQRLGLPPVTRTRPAAA